MRFGRVAGLQLRFPRFALKDQVSGSLHSLKRSQEHNDI